MNPKYTDFSTIDSTMQHLIEECSEVILEISKFRRFGPNGCHPDDPDQVTNLQRVADEAVDLMHCLWMLGTHLDEQLGAERLGRLQAVCQRQDKYYALRMLLPEKF